MPQTVVLDSSGLGQSLQLQTLGPRTVQVKKLNRSLQIALRLIPVSSQEPCSHPGLLQLGRSGIHGKYWVCSEVLKVLKGTRY